MATDTATLRRRTATLHLPLVNAELRAPHAPRPHLAVPHVSVPRPSMPPLPHRQEVVDLGRGVAGLLPPNDQLALYGGLGAAAALGILEWPVAVAVAAGTAVARHGMLRGSLAEAARAVSGAVRESPPNHAAAPSGATKRTAAKKPTAGRATAKTASAGQAPSAATGRRAARRTASAT